MIQLHLDNICTTDDYAAVSMYHNELGFKCIVRFYYFCLFVCFVVVVIFWIWHFVCLVHFVTAYCTVELH